MRYLTILKAIFLSSFLFFTWTAIPVHGGRKDIEILSNNLEKALNNKQESIFQKLFINKDAEKLQSEYKNFLAKFPNAKWEITPKGINKEGNNIMEVFIQADKIIGDYKYNLNSTQIIIVEQNQGKVLSHSIVSQTSIMNSSAKELKINLAIPNKVLTGSKYDVDIILKEPLGDSIIAGGLIEISQENDQAISPYIHLSPISAGGIFRSVKAPLKPGKQKLAALIAHPDGLIAVTKIIKVNK